MNIGQNWRSAEVSQSDYVKLLIKSFKVLALFIILLITTRLISDVSFKLAGMLNNVFGRIDPDGSFLIISIHHIFQAIEDLRS
jgi:hypothetical protein